MGFFDRIMDGVNRFKDAAKAGADFNPLLEEVMMEIEELYAKGKLSGPIYDAEQAYEKEHAEYKAKGVHTNANDSKNDLMAINHFMGALAKSDDIGGDLKEKIQKLVAMKDQMDSILGGLGKLL